MAEIDGDWFHRQLEGKGQSLRALARHLGKDASAVSRTFSGKRRMTMEEAAEIAAFLGVSVTDVMHHAGITADREGLGPRIPLSATIGEDGEVRPLPESQPLPQAVLDRALPAIGASRHHTIIAAQVRASSGPLSIWDDAVLFFAASDGIEPGAIGALSICGLKGGKQILAKLDRARKTGEARVVSPAGKSEEVTLVMGAPVLVVIP
ncbi:transcriptional regulator with XRE-family HTH domain [Rhizobium sp. BK529]|uniref:helix-turn-helix domain-containing protein n=1 Tax=unclassified Rhizobium TaxID=2613769 RepID=UPI001053BC56|nr:MULTISPECIES: helix-turn-helix transcriptional regulator [unclassified Rhizobium]MBB3590561.1 transcriptional regulator with XRE-family HTH domain [Rhizobium sp. BK529]TCS05249.1 helix-turn-helix protein [Rhizobium sp. BK418]